MRSLWMLPFTFVAGVDGFALFVPYLLLIALVGLFIRWQKNRELRELVLAEVRV